MTDRESEWIDRYGHLRANVPLRRAAYGWFIVLAILTFAVSLVDILWLDSILMWGVIAAYAIILLWGILLLISRRRKPKRKKAKKDELVEFELEDRMDLEAEYLRCPECRHVFEFDMEHRDGRKEVRMNCPECGYIGQLPDEDRAPTAAAVPGGEARGPTFVCNTCGEHWRVGAIGHDPKSDVRFSACPHCGEPDDFGLLQDDDPSTPY